MLSALTLAAALACASALAADPSATAEKRWTGLLRVSGALTSQENPVTKVVGLLKDMQTQISKDEEADEETYQKMQCWCETGEGAKKAAIAEGQRKINNLMPVIEEFQAKGSQLSTEVDGLREDIAHSKEALQTATALRAREHDDFKKAEQDAEETVSGCTMALNVLASNHDAALPQEAVLQARQVLSRHKVFDSTLLQKLALSPPQQKAIASLMQKNPHLQQYAPQSAELVGMLKTMQQEFQTNLDTMRAEEANAETGFNELKPAKEQEIRSASTSLRQKMFAKVKADESSQDAKLDMKVTENVRKADENALLVIREQCPTLDKQYAARTKVRKEENVAIGETIKILTDNDARDAMHSTLAFVQLSSVRRAKQERSKRNAIAKILHDAAMKGTNSQLALLALAVKNDVFGEVKAGIDKMVAQLNQEEKDEFKHRDYCTDELHNNGMQMDEKYHDKDNQVARIAECESIVKKATEEVKVARAEVAGLQISMRQAYEAREGEFKVSGGIIANQILTKETLDKALARLQEFYGMRPALLQQADNKQAHKKDAHAHAQAQPAFREHKKSSGANGVFALLKEIINEAQEQMTQTTSDEHQDQMAYEEYGRDQNKIIGLRMKLITERLGEKAQADEDLASTKSDLKMTGQDIEGLHSYANGIHRECDFIMDNFQARRDARKEEIVALNEAKAMMSGMA